MKVIVYADTVRKARKHYPSREGEQVGHRAAKDFKKPEKADKVIYAKKYEKIKEAYEGKKSDK